MAEIKNFSKQRKRIQFQIDDDTFEAVPAIPAQVMIDFVRTITSADPTQLSPEQQVNILADMLEIVLLPDSLKLFRQRMADVTNPIEMDQINNVVTWLFEEYGMRPTIEPSPSSSGGSLLASGITSTENTQDVVSISSGSPFTSS